MRNKEREREREGERGLERVEREVRELIEHNAVRLNTNATRPLIMPYMNAFVI